MIIVDRGNIFGNRELYYTYYLSPTPSSPHGQPIQLNAESPTAIVRKEDTTARIHLMYNLGNIQEKQLIKYWHLVSLFASGGPWFPNDN